ncbi:iron ABC transporter substrate-binding protein [Alkalihalobacillus alcalophilus ATCC 27647 = CGMCC 1.3604]|uniref:Iron ABC transporter substrate-binding protein n=1 Tax=Alkalihalobacillus alcalophilus ATCC 27647 = CGMCC 1.3604 TaxID=1218173 RepID=A0A094XB40_ALKAL|nr:iron-siderophore ABC transporter substrate-binding protein [Alkalihalobacillus alcalophilus]KGA96020.1 iron ABC transporter substrate-binding protein [Alkalihalobacillus alcalophilus ATCC 27647 = CGMCC 1.3604]MED1561283.1 iron-siderophore ABC transporter substrate-binding protein [Alkalihalobacillus alcalophilus]THG91868.1 iron ABC transporter substrate-binding protein [Alkalihalobacillus alcalophilus ATCC 27647 = CGMCC 1.3604]
MSKKAVVLFLMSLFLVGGILVGCGNQAEEDNTEEPVVEDEGQVETDDEVRVVTNALGETEITGTPERIVTLYQGATDTAVAMGVIPVGAVESWLEQPVYNYLKDDLGDVQIVGQETQPNLEEIAKLNPDLIIASRVRHEEIFEQLSEIAPTVADESLNNFKETTELLGQALNQEDLANELLSDWDNRVVDFQAKAEENVEDWPMHVSVLNFRADHARIYVGGFAGTILTELGFNGPKNLEGTDEEILRLMDKESIPEMNADVFYTFMEEDETVKNTFEEWTSHPLWQNLDAVQAEQTYIVDEIIWNLGGGIVAANLLLDDVYERLGLEK